MRSDKTQFASLTTRQKVTAGIFVVVVIIILWQLIGLFRGSKSQTPPVTGAKGGVQMQPMQPSAPQPAELPKPKVMSKEEMQLVQLQQETQAKYLAALNELQMLKVSREIAETTQAIMAAKLATVTAQKNIVNLLAPSTPIAPGSYAKGLVYPATPGATSQQAPAQPVQPGVTYTVISVSQLQYRWGAVLGYQGSLYNVSVGDVLPADGSKVIGIDKSGVTLEKNGEKKKISLVPVI